MLFEDGGNSVLLSCDVGDAESNLFEEFTRQRDSSGDSGEASRNAARLTSSSSGLIGSSQPKSESSSSSYLSSSSTSSSMGAKHGKCSISGC